MATATEAPVPPVELGVQSRSTHCQSPVAVTGAEALLFDDGTSWPRITLSAVPLGPRTWSRTWYVCPGRNEPVRAQPTPELAPPPAVTRSLVSPEAAITESAVVSIVAALSTKPPSAAPEQIVELVSKPSYWYCVAPLRS